MASASIRNITKPRNASIDVMRVVTPTGAVAGTAVGASITAIKALPEHFRGRHARADSLQLLD